MQNYTKIIRILITLLQDMFYTYLAHDTVFQ